MDKVNVQLVDVYHSPQAQAVVSILISLMLTHYQQASFQTLPSLFLEQTVLDGLDLYRGA